ncbi:MAG: ferredoxin family protein [Thermoprotei archaeon]|nr:ferredoxin family protein [Thermoprotei archaeon]
MDEEGQVMEKDALGRIIRDLSNTEWWGMLRKEIPWYPRVDYEKCTEYDLCFMTCGRVVYDWNFKQMKPIVASPYNCLVGCSTCANLCLRGAINFPSLEVLGKYRDLRKSCS